VKKIREERKEERKKILERIRKLSKVGQDPSIQEEMFKFLIDTGLLDLISNMLAFAPDHRLESKDALDLCREIFQNSIFPKHNIFQDRANEWFEIEDCLQFIRSNPDTVFSKEEEIPDFENMDTENYVKAMGNFVINKFGEDKFLEILPRCRFESDFPGMKEYCGVSANKHVLFIVIRILKNLLSADNQLDLENITGHPFFKYVH